MIADVPKYSKRWNDEQAIERRLAGLFKKAGWKVEPQPRPEQASARRPDLVIAKPRLRYVVEVKSASEARRDRLQPLLAAAILEARAMAQEFPGANTLAVVGAPKIPKHVLLALKDYAARVAPESAVGIVDLEGGIEFVGRGLEGLNEQRGWDEAWRQALVAPGSFALFSDLNQWMLKVLLSPRLPEKLIRAPRVEVRSALHLAEVARVSAPSAFRLVRNLKHEGFLAPAEPLRLMRIPELLRRWHAASHEPVRELKMRWLIPGDPAKQLQRGLRAYVSSDSAPGDELGGGVASGRKPQPRVCLGLFAAADALGYGLVHGVPPHLYVEDLHPGVLEKLGLSAAGPAQPPDVFVRLPKVPEAVFRASVLRDGVPVCDILQVWLDVAGHPPRGREQADEIERRALKAFVDEGDQW